MPAAALRSAPQPIAVIDLVGLAAGLLDERTPRLLRFAREHEPHGPFRTIRPPLPAVTCTVQSTMLTGLEPAGHGAVANGWFDRDLGEVLMWRQSNRLVQGEKAWETARRIDPTVTCANLCWWYAMGGSHEVSLTPRPIYAADGRKIPDCWTRPAGLRDELQRTLGSFPLFRFWGPAAGIASSRWIAEAAKIVWRRHAPTISLVYLPHLDYDLQRFGPDDPRIAKSLGEIDEVAGDLIEFYAAAGVKPIVLSEYGIAPVRGEVAINRELRRLGCLQMRLEGGREAFDPFASEAFAVVDHQMAHVYVRGGDSRRHEIAERLRAIEGVAEVLADDALAAAGLAHARSGDLVAIAAPDRWFSWGHWLDDAKAPDFARCVEIFRKTGFDPCELLLDPAIRMPRLAVAWRLLKKALGQRVLMDLIPLDGRLVGGSHGRSDLPPPHRPLLLGDLPRDLPREVPAAAIREVMLRSVFGDGVPLPPASPANA
jgi:predicted AlkP superfamily pyrophosphatase or phosphodiesterase